jgi:hypothetical protein
VEDVLNLCAQTHCECRAGVLFSGMGIKGKSLDGVLL